MKNNVVIAQDVLDAFTYSFAPTPETVEIAGVTIEIWQDQDAENPYRWTDCMAPALWLSARGGLKEYGGADLESFFWNVKSEWVSRHWRKVAAVLDLAESDVDSECRETLANYGGRLPSVRQEYFAERLTEMRAESWESAIDYLEALAALYRLAGMAAGTFQRNGYCQGDSVFGLIVHTPGWRERVGFNGDAARDMEIEANTYGAWVWGDVYGFSVGNAQEGEAIECCGGFYGFDVAYMASEIAEKVNRILSRRAAAVAADIAAARPDLAPCYA